MQKILHVQTISINLFKKKKKKSTSTYSQTQEYQEEIIKTNIKSSKNFESKVTEQGKTLPIIHWLSKMHNTAIGPGVIFSSKNCSTESLSEVILSFFGNYF